jgi:phospholipid-binding lipoprotein MlaA
LAALGSMLLTACAGAQRDPLAQIDDPYEAANRQFLAMNQAVFAPIASADHAVTPSIIRQGIGNVGANMREPRIFANDLLQLRFGALATTAARFAVNSTFGVGGLFDVATPSGLAQQTGDFGQTLFVWGVGDGPYLVAPFLGPLTGRDAVGSVVDMAADPASWALSAAFGWRATLGFAGLDFVTQVGQLKQAQNSSVEFYSFLRSSYYQTRRAQLREAIGLPADVESPAEIGPTGPARPTPKAPPKPASASQ